MRWVEHVACLEDMEESYIVLSGELEVKGHLGDIYLDGRIMLKPMWFHAFGDTSSCQL
jgi:hypothetical protein